MLYFFRNDDQLGRLIADKLSEFSAAHKTILIDEGNSYLSEYENDYKDHKSIIAFLEEYGKLLENQSLISADACYIDPSSGKDACII